MHAILVNNHSDDHILFKPRLGVAHIVAPGGRIHLAPEPYKVAAIVLKEAANDIYPESGSSEEIFHETTVTNTGEKTLIFTPYPILPAPTIIKPGETAGLHYLKYNVSVEK